MSLRPLVAVLCVSFVASITVAAQSPTQASVNQALAFKVSIVEMIGVEPDEVDRAAKSRDSLNRLMNEGKAKLTAVLHVRTRVGESFSARVGKRVPIQTAAFPVFQTSDEPRSGQRRPMQSGAAFPQIEYENTGLTVDGTSVAAVNATVDIRLNIEMIGIDTSTGTLTPSFAVRTLKSVVRMRQDETAIPVGLIQGEQSAATSDPRSPVGATDLSRGSFIVLLTTIPVQ